MSSDIDLDELFMGIVTVGERGQIVIPVEARKKLPIHAGERLLMICNPHKHGIAFLKMDTMREFVNQVADRLNTLEENLKMSSLDQNPGSPKESE